MTPRADDRRVRRTRQLLRDALLALMVEQGYEGLTVQDILDRADLGRATFYTHYQDKQDLLMDTFAGLRHVFQHQEPGKSVAGTHAERVEQISLRFFRHAAEQRKLYRVMVGKESGALLHAYATRLLSDELREHLARLTPRGAQPGIPTDVMVAYLVSTLLALLTWWLDHDLPYSPEQMDVMFRKLALPGVADALGTHQRFTED